MHHRWGLLVSAKGCVRTEGWPEAGLPYGLDNGAWTAHQKGEEFDQTAFEKAVGLVGDGAEFVVVPDIVAGGLKSLAFSLEWLPRLAGVGRRRLLAVQDGMNPIDIECLLGPDLGVFVGGSTDWKWRTLPYWALAAQRKGAYLHVGRVNTQKRISACVCAGADSFDGTSVTRFAKTIGPLDSVSRQTAFSLGNKK